jgi:DNA-directed RNA polymerase specialized sigma24 family protein
VGKLETADRRSTIEQQIATVYADHALALRRRCVRLTGNATAAEDLMQETLSRRCPTTSTRAHTCS